MEDLSKEQVENIFKVIDKDNDGFITQDDLLATEYFQELFDGNSDLVISAFQTIPHQKMSLNNFVMFCYGKKFNLVNFVMTKFKAEQYLNKYLGGSAPGQAAPDIKRSYLRFRAHGAQQKDILHSVSFEFGVDKPHQSQKIKEVSTALGHAPHEVFLMLKIKTNKNGEQVAQKLAGLANTLIEMASGMLPEFESILGGIKSHCKYFQGYVYFILQVDNPLVDSVIHSFNQVLESISPQCAFKFRGKIASNLSNLLAEDFDYSKSGGEFLFEFDIDHVTMKKIKEIGGDSINEYSETSPKQIFSLLFQELKIDAEFNNLGEAMTSALHIDLDELPKPCQPLEGLKEMGIKEMVEQFSEGGQDLLTLLNQNCQGEGQFSINFHDFFLKVNFDIHIKNAFDFLG